MLDGATAIKPLTVKPQPQHSVRPNTVCDFEHQCYPEKGGPAASTPAAPPAIVVKPIAPRPQVPDEPVVATWRDCMEGALQNYEQSHNLHALQMATGSCQVRLEEQDGEDYAGEEPPIPLASPQAGEHDLLRSRDERLRVADILVAGEKRVLPTVGIDRADGLDAGATNSATMASSLSSFSATAASIDSSRWSAGHGASAETAPFGVASNS